MRADRSLPSLLALRAFEAVARHGSMTRASAELLITQSAVSHHIRGLEEELGTRLFVRHARGIALTEAGQSYRTAVETAFATIAEATAGLRAAAATPLVRLSVLPSFAAHWLVPRLARFRAAHPEVVLELDPTLRQTAFDDGVELAIRYGGGVWSGLAATRLMAERLTPVIAAHRVDQAATLPLLLTSKAFDWEQWCARAGHDFAGRPRLQFTDYNIALQAALNGEGVAMGRLRLIQDRLDRGELVAPHAPIVETDAAAYWIVHPRDRAPSPGAARFIAWIQREARA